jgi:hypothetical protein
MNVGSVRAHVAQRLLHRRAERDPDILDGMV